MPRLFCVLEGASKELVYSSVRYSGATSFLRSVPERVRDCFTIVRYDPNENWDVSGDGVTNNENDNQNERG